MHFWDDIANWRVKEAFTDLWHNIEDLWHDIKNALSETEVRWESPRNLQRGAEQSVNNVAETLRPSSLNTETIIERGKAANAEVTANYGAAIEAVKERNAEASGRNALEKTLKRHQHQAPERIAKKYKGCPHQKSVPTISP